MKRIILCLVIFSMICGHCFAEETDFSSFSYEELSIMYKRIYNELKSRPEFGGVLVPAGAWTVGIDIPAGVYSIYPYIQGQKGSFTVWAKETDVNSLYKPAVFALVFGYDYNVFGKIELKEGYYIESKLDTIFSQPIKLGF